ncbi:hypothetical protein C4J81_09620 [Deltaproteobacteria bacterium Smac51]|nr:hypothetical protein C4J81_09620 [Deltaproteobacteria bacterium Smac51]
MDMILKENELREQMKAQPGLRNWKAFGVTLLIVGGLIVLLGGYAAYRLIAGLFEDEAPPPPQATEESSGQLEEEPLTEPEEAAPPAAAGPETETGGPAATDKWTEAVPSDSNVPLEPQQSAAAGATDIGDIFLDHDGVWRNRTRQPNLPGFFGTSQELYQDDDGAWKSREKKQEPDNIFEAGLQGVWENMIGESLGLFGGDLGETYVNLLSGAFAGGSLDLGKFTDTLSGGGHGVGSGFSLQPLPEPAPGILEGRGLDEFEAFDPSKPVKSEWEFYQDPR